MKPVILPDGGFYLIEYVYRPKFELAMMESRKRIAYRSVISWKVFFPWRTTPDGIYIDAVGHNRLDWEDTHIERMVTDMVEEIGYAGLSEAIAKTRETGKPLVIDFWAPWCGPCRALAPIVGEVSDELRGKIDFAKIDVEENGEAALEYGVMSIPTLIVFKDGHEVNRIVGSLSKDSLLLELDGIAD